MGISEEGVDLENTEVVYSIRTVDHFEYIGYVNKDKFNSIFKTRMLIGAKNSNFDMDIHMTRKFAMDRLINTNGNNIGRATVFATVKINDIKFVLKVELVKPVVEKAKSILPIKVTFQYMG